MANVDYAFRNKGLGKALYEATIMELKKVHPEGFYFLPTDYGSKTKGGSRVNGLQVGKIWKHLGKTYPQEGEALFIPGAEFISKMATDVPTTKVL